MLFICLFIFAIYSGSKSADLFELASYLYKFVLKLPSEKNTIRSPLAKASLPHKALLSYSIPNRLSSVGNTSIDEIGTETVSGLQPLQYITQKPFSVSILPVVFLPYNSEI